MKNRMIRIIAPHFVAGIETYCGSVRRRKSGALMPVHRCALIVRYMEEWTIGKIMRFCRSKGWKYELENLDGGFTKGGGL